MVAVAVLDRVVWDLLSEALMFEGGEGTRSISDRGSSRSSEPEAEPAFPIWGTVRSPCSSSLGKGESRRRKGLKESRADSVGPCGPWEGLWLLLQMRQKTLEGFKHQGDMTLGEQVQHQGVNLGYSELELEWQWWRNVRFWIYFGGRGHGDAPRKRLYEDGGRGWSYAAISQGMLGATTSWKRQRRILP